MAYEPAELTKQMVDIGTGQKRFLRDNVFARQVVHRADYIDFGKMDVSARILPVVPRNSPGVNMETADGVLKTVRPPRFRVDLPIIESDAATANPALAGFNSRYTDPGVQKKALMALKMRAFTESLADTEEAYCAQILLTGAANLVDAVGATQATIDFGYTGDGSTAGDSLTIQPTLTGTDAWDSASADILGELEDLERQIRETSSYGGPLAVLLGYNALKLLRKNKGVKELLDNRNMAMGQLSPETATSAVGMLGNYELYKYSFAARTARATSATAQWNANKIVMVPWRSDRLERHYGGIYERVGGPGSEMDFIPTSMFSKTYVQENPPAEFLAMESRPIPVVFDVKNIRVIQVAS